MVFSRVWKTGLVAALVALALGGASFATASGSSGTFRDFKVFDHTTKSTNVNVGKKSFGIGDSFVFTDLLMKLDRRTRIGTLHGQCTAVALSGRSGVAHCAVTAHIRGGTLEGAGDTNFSGRDFAIAMTGGTGRWSGASGQFLVHTLPGHHGNNSIVTVDFAN